VSAQILFWFFYNVLFFPYLCGPGGPQEIKLIHSRGGIVLVIQLASLSRQSESGSGNDRFTGCVGPPGSQKRPPMGLFHTAKIRSRVVIDYRF
jgi:hypothetical protein